MTTQLINNFIINSQPLPAWGVTTILAEPYIEGLRQLVAGFSQENLSLDQRVLHVLTGIALSIPLVNLVLYIALRFFCVSNEAPKVAFTSLEQVDNLAEETRTNARRITHEDLQIDIMELIDNVQTAVHQAMQNRNPQPLSILFGKAAFELQNINEQIDAFVQSASLAPIDSDATEWQEKMVAALSQPEYRFRSLLEEGRRNNFLNYRFNYFAGGTFFHHLAKNDKACHYARLALAYDIDLSIQDFWGNTPLIWAIANANNETAMDILQKGGGCHLDIQSKTGRNSALHLAVGKGYKDRSRDGQLLKYTNLELVEALIFQKCDVNLQNVDGNTPLHVACFRRDVRMIQSLLKAGANRTLRNREGKRAEDVLLSDYATSCLAVSSAAGAFLFDEKEHENSLEAATSALGSS